ncbi:MAG: enoyl-ACP reductase [Chloroflexi bacterium]|nr:enoyl-ACP reductase [Chloroflexota bacterium]
MTRLDLTGKKGVVFGVANARSIAWAISEALADAGAELAFTYQTERLFEPVTKAISALGDPCLVQCDATEPAQVEAAYETMVGALGGLDFVVHSIAYAERDDLGGDFSKTSLAGFRTALDVSAFTLIPVTALAVPHMGEKGGSIVTLTFNASEKVYPGYNVMGTAKAALENEVRQLAAEFGPKSVRVNAVSAGPLATLAARSLPGFNLMRRAHADRAPLGRNITHVEVADAAVFLLSDLASGITGHVLPVDGGYGIMGI